MADPAGGGGGVSGIRLNPHLRPNYFIFMGIIKTNEVESEIELHLNPLSRKPGAATEKYICSFVRLFTCTFISYYAIYCVDSAAVQKFCGIYTLIRFDVASICIQFPFDQTFKKCVHL